MFFTKRLRARDHGVKTNEPAKNPFKKVVQCKGIVLFKLLQDNTTINYEVYCDKMDQLNDLFKQKKPGLFNKNAMVFHHDKTRRHRSLVTRQKLLYLI